MSNANTEVRMTLLDGRSGHNVLVSVAQTYRLIALGKGEQLELQVMLGPGERAMGAELQLKLKYRGAKIAGHRLGEVRLVRSGPTPTVPSPPIDGRLTITVDGPAYEDAWGYD